MRVHVACHTFRASVENMFALSRLNPHRTKMVLLLFLIGVELTKIAGTPKERFYRCPKFSTFARDAFTHATAFYLPISVHSVMAFGTLNIHPHCTMKRQFKFVIHYRYPPEHDRFSFVIFCCSPLCMYFPYTAHCTTQPNTSNGSSYLSLDVTNAMFI